ITPEECASIRSIARWVLPVLVGPSTAVTPAPGARPLATEVAEFERIIILGVYAASRLDVFHNATLLSRSLSLGTRTERNTPESVTPVHSGFVHATCRANSFTRH